MHSAATVHAAAAHVASTSRAAQSAMETVTG
jgi:hypothetical protein